MADDEVLFCRLNVSPKQVKVSGLQRKFPSKVRRSLTPLDFQQENDQLLQGLVTLFEEQPVTGQVLNLNFQTPRSIDHGTPDSYNHQVQ